MFRCICAVSHELSASTFNSNAKDPTIVCRQSNKLLPRIYIISLSTTCEPYSAINGISVVTSGSNWPLSRILNRLADLKTKESSRTVCIENYGYLEMACNDIMCVADFMELCAYTIWLMPDFFQLRLNDILFCVNNLRAIEEKCASFLRILACDKTCTIFCR